MLVAGLFSMHSDSKEEERRFLFLMDTLVRRAVNAALFFREETCFPFEKVHESEPTAEFCPVTPLWRNVKNLEALVLGEGPQRQHWITCECSLQAFFRCISTAKRRKGDFCSYWARALVRRAVNAALFVRGETCFLFEKEGMRASRQRSSAP